MKLKVTVLTRRVLARLNESADELESAVIYGDMGMELRRLVEDLLPDAARIVFKDAGHEDISEAQPLGMIWRRDAEGVGIMELPPSFLRLVELRMSGWKESLYTLSDSVISVPAIEEEAEEEEEAEYEGPWLRHHSEAGVAVPRVREQQEQEPPKYEPAVQIGFEGAGRVLRVYGCGADSVPEAAWYLPEPEISGGAMWIPSSLVGAVVEKTADMVKEVIE